jgi:hypothetical protein
MVLILLTYPNYTSIENTMNYIHHSEFFIGYLVIAGAINKHVVMISNFTEEDHEFTYYQNQNK